MIAKQVRPALSKPNNGHGQQTMPSALIGERAQILSGSERINSAQLETEYMAASQPFVCY